jgi:hypothetical protein
MLLLLVKIIIPIHQGGLIELVKLNIRILHDKVMNGDQLPDVMVACQDPSPSCDRPPILSLCMRTHSAFQGGQSVLHHRTGIYSCCWP